MQAGLTRCRSPWVLGALAWRPQRAKQAAIWLAQRMHKPLLKLTDADYCANSLQASCCIMLLWPVSSSRVQLLASQCASCLLMRLSSTEIFRL